MLKGSCFASRRRIANCVRSMSPSATAAMTFLAAASIFSIADRVIMLDKGAQGIIAEGRPLELAKNSRDPRVTEFLHRGDLVV